MAKPEGLPKEWNNDFYTDRDSYETRHTGKCELFVDGLTDSMKKDTLMNIFGRFSKPTDIRIVERKPKLPAEGQFTLEEEPIHLVVEQETSTKKQRDNGKYFAFVEFSNVREAELALRELNHALPYNLTVKFAGPRKPAVEPPLPLPKMKPFMIEKLEPVVPSLGRGKRMADAAKISQSVGCPNFPPAPIPGVQMLLKQPYVSGSRQAKTLGSWILNRDPNIQYSTEGTTLGSMPESDRLSFRLCANCSLKTILKCSCCEEFFCSKVCCTEHGYSQCKPSM